MEDSKRRLFLWGAVLAWVPALPLVFALVHAFRDISRSHATGLAGVAGGLAEIYVPLSLFVTLLAEVAAIALLARSFTKGQSVRSALAAVSICCGVVTTMVLLSLGWVFSDSLCSINEQRSSLSPDLVPSHCLYFAAESTS